MQSFEMLWLIGWSIFNSNERISRINSNVRKRWCSAITKCLVYYRSTSLQMGEQVVEVLCHKWEISLSPLLHLIFIIFILFIYFSGLLPFYCCLFLMSLVFVFCLCVCFFFSGIASCVWFIFLFFLGLLPFHALSFIFSLFIFLLFSLYACYVFL